MFLDKAAQFLPSGKTTSGDVSLRLSLKGGIDNPDGTLLVTYSGGQVLDHRRSGTAGQQQVEHVAPGFVHRLVVVLVALRHPCIGVHDHREAAANLVARQLEDTTSSEVRLGQTLDEGLGLLAGALLRQTPVATLCTSGVTC